MEEPESSSVRVFYDCGNEIRERSFGWMGKVEERSRVDFFGLCEENLRIQVSEKGSLSVKTQRTFFVAENKRMLQKSW